MTVALKSPVPLHAPARRAAAKSSAKALGSLPEWNLADLYPALDAPEVKRDLEKGEAECVAFEKAYKGKLAELAAGAGGGPRARRGGQALRGDRRSARPADVLCGPASTAGNTTDPVRAKFYGDMQERITAASSHLLFFTLELNRIDDAVLEAAMADPALGHYRPWLEDIRKDKPYQLEDRVEQLFHEKSVTGYSAWNRLFDETMASLRFKVGGKTLAIEPTLNLLQDPNESKRKAAAEALAKTLQGQPAAVHPDHQHARQGQGDLRPLARLRRRRGRRAISPTGSSPRWSMRWCRRCARPIRGCRTATTR